MNKKIKNTLEIIYQITGTRIVFCYGQEAYKKYAKKVFKLDMEIPYIAVSTELTLNETGELAIIIGVKELENIYTLKSAIIHELSHAVSQLMEYFGFVCDELRSYTLQYLYLEVMPFIDNIVSTQNNTKKIKHNKGNKNAK